MIGYEHGTSQPASQQVNQLVNLFIDKTGLFLDSLYFDPQYADQIDGID